MNDSLGHAAGDELLKTLAARFLSRLEAFESAHSQGKTMVARLSGDEFAIIVANVPLDEELDALAESLLQKIAEPMQIADRTIASSGSIGVSLFPEHGTDTEDLVKAADAALYVAKELGRARHVVFEHSFTTEAEQARKIEQELRKAIERGELQLHYQPKVDLETDTVAGFEALLRWYNADLGFVSPKDFIPIAEERGLICELGAWCIDEACRQIRTWQDGGFETVRVSVNVSSAQFRDSDVEREISDALVRHEIDPSIFEIELTESLILDESDSTALTLRDLRAIGVQIALDDFGTGYSALTYLNRFPLDTVKMDRGFLRGIEDNDSIAGIASAVITMSHSLGFEVVAEGVDSERQSQLLRSMGCDQIQGFLYSPAVPAAEATRFLASQGGPRPTVKSRIAAPEVDQVLSEVAFRKPEGSEIPPATPATPATPALDEPTITDVTERIPRPQTHKATRVLVIEAGDPTLGRIALRMVRLGADVHLLADLDEASLFVRDEEPSCLDLLIVPPEVDLERLAVCSETIQKLAAEQAPRILVLGDEPDLERRRALRESVVDWVLWGAAEDSELRFFISTAQFHGRESHRKRSVRVPVEATAWIRASGQRRTGTLSSLSRRGAFIETSDAYEIGQPVRVEFKVEETWIRVFANVAYHEESDEDNGIYRPHGVGVIFYELDRDTEDALSSIIELVWTRHLP